MTPSSTTPLYTSTQVDSFFKRIKIPQSQQHTSIERLSDSEKLSYLALLQRHTLCSIPFENLTLHYSPHHAISLHPTSLFQKIVQTPGRGGYCMENNRLFGTVLLSLGFQCYSAGARVNADGRYTGWSHMVNLVTIAGRKYMVDVGFGADGPIEPMLLDREQSYMVPHIKPATAGLCWKGLEEHTDPEQRVWVYQHCIGDGEVVKDIYCFTETEFLASDYGVMSFYVSTARTTFFTREVICARYLAGDDGRIIGVDILYEKQVKRRVHGKIETRVELRSEDERAEALREWFGIELAADEKDGIIGLGSQIKAG